MTQLTTYPRGWFVVAFSSEIPPLGREVAAVLRRAARRVPGRGRRGPRARRLLRAHGGGPRRRGRRGRRLDPLPFPRLALLRDGRVRRDPIREEDPAEGAAARLDRARGQRRRPRLARRARREPRLRDPASSPTSARPTGPPWNTFYYAIKTHPREIVENIADRAHFPSVHLTEIDEFEFSVEGHTATQQVKGRARLPAAASTTSPRATTYHGPGYLVMRMIGMMQNYMIVAHTPVDTVNLELRMGVMLKNVAEPGRWTESRRALHGEPEVRLRGRHQRSGRTSSIARSRCSATATGPITQLRRWYRQFYATREERLAEQRA